MRVALLLSGQFRNGKDLIYNLFESIIKQYQPDIFISYNYDTDIEVNLDILNQLYNPKGIQFDKYPMLSAYSNNVAAETNPNSLVRMLYGIDKANRLKSDYEVANGFKYDFVIRSRFDLEYSHPLELKNFNDITIPIGWDHRGGYNYTFAYGSSEAMDYYSSVYNNLQTYLNEGALLHPESILKYHLDKGPYGILRTHIPTTLRGMQLDKLEYRQK
jgi:hypothetical protein